LGIVIGEQVSALILFLEALELDERLPALQEGLIGIEVALVLAYSIFYLLASHHVHFHILPLYGGATE
jgi:hypothetical protein